MSRPHVAMIVEHAGGTGAVASVALNQARQLSRWFRISFCSDSLPNDLDRQWNPILLHPPRFYWLHRFCHVPNQGGILLAVSRALERLHKHDPIDFLWCHSHPIAAWPLARFHRRHQVPYGMTVHGDIFDRPKGTYDPFLTWLYKRATPRAYRRASVIQVLAPVWEKYLHRWGVDETRVVVIPNGISESDFSPATPKNAGTKGSFRVLFVGRLSIEKGVGFLLQTAVLLRNRGMAFQIDVVGDGPDLATSKSFVQHHDLAGQVHFHGRIARESLGGVYAAADVVCIPSISEPLATVALESLVHGTPVVATDVGGNSYMIRDGWNGRLVPPGDPAAMADVLEELIRNPENRRSIAKNARSSVREKFSWDRVGEQMAATIQNRMNLPS